MRRRDRYNEAKREQERDGGAENQVGERREETNDVNERESERAPHWRG